MEKIKGNEKSKELLLYSLFHMLNWEICPLGDQIFSFFLTDLANSKMKPMMETGPPQKETIHFRYKCWDTAGRFLPWRSQKPLRAVASAQGWILGAVIQGHQHSYARALLSASQGG